jgi:hypothetical protein
MVTGEYNRNGYTVFRNGEEVYSAGNHGQDSTEHESAPRFAVHLHKLSAMCRQTVREIAAESGDVAGDVSRGEESEQDDRGLQRRRFWLRQR